MSSDDKASAENPPQSEQILKRERSTLCKVLPTDRIAFDRQVEILRAYAACYESNGGKPVSNGQAGAILKPAFSASTIGVAVPFFTDIGLIARNGTDFIPSPDLVAYNQAVSLSTSEAKRKLRPLFENTWFCRLLAPRLQLNPQPLNECVAMLALEAKAEKEHLSRVEPLINFLEWSGIVAIVGSTVSFIPSSGEKPAEIKNLPANTPNVFTDQEEHSLYLDRHKMRKFTINSPLFISKAEYQRICKWIEVTLIIEDPDAEPEPGSQR